MGGCEGSGATSVCPKCLANPRGYPWKALAENPQTISVLPPLHVCLWENFTIFLSHSPMLLALLGFTLSPSKPKTQLTFLMQPSKCQNHSFWEIHFSSSAKCWKRRGWVRNVHQPQGELQYLTSRYLVFQFFVLCVHTAEIHVLVPDLVWDGLGESTEKRHGSAHDPALCAWFNCSFFPICPFSSIVQPQHLLEKPQSCLP